jgi:hypothetical protein
MSFIDFQFKTTSPHAKTTESGKQSRYRMMPAPVDFNSSKTMAIGTTKHIAKSKCHIVIPPEDSGAGV